MQKKPRDFLVKVPKVLENFRKNQVKVESKLQIELVQKPSMKNSIVWLSMTLISTISLLLICAVGKGKWCSTFLLNRNSRKMLHAKHKSLPFFRLCTFFLSFLIVRGMLKRSKISIWSFLLKILAAHARLLHHPSYWGWTKV